MSILLPTGTRTAQREQRCRGERRRTATASLPSRKSDWLRERFDDGELASDTSSTSSRLMNLRADVISLMRRNDKLAHCIEQDYESLVPSAEDEEKLNAMYTELNERNYYLSAIYKTLRNLPLFNRVGCFNYEVDELRRLLDIAKYIKRLYINHSSSLKSYMDKVAPTDEISIDEMKAIYDAASTRAAKRAFKTIGILFVILIVYVCLAAVFKPELLKQSANKREKDSSSI